MSYVPSSLQNFGKYLQQSQRTDVILKVIEALRDSNTYDKQEVSGVLDMAIEDPASWLTDVSGLQLDCPAR